MADTIQREVYVENELERSLFLLKPTLGDKYPEITKDPALTHFDKFEIRIALMRQEIMDIIILDNFLPWMTDAFESFERDQGNMIQFCRSKFGFESKLQRAKMTGDIQSEKGFEKDQTKTVFGSKGGN